jgi:hypothetical protein
LDEAADFKVQFEIGRWPAHMAQHGGKDSLTYTCDGNPLTIDTNIETEH